MLTAGFGIAAALAFVLGLGALALWGLKRLGNIGLSPRSRVPVEVVQRISLGPKTGLAVVRVGEKVMAVSVGDGGIRPLFELDEEDRQRVIATSSVATPLVSSQAASQSIAKTLQATSAVPGSAGKFGALLAQNLRSAMTGTPFVSSATIASAMTSEPAQADARRVAHSVARPVAQPAARPDDREFLAVLGMSLRPTARLTGIALAVLLSSFGAARVDAQAAPDSTRAVRPAVDSMQQALISSLNQAAAALPVAPAAPAAPNATANRGARGARTATPATPVGNGASVSAMSPNGSRPVSDMRAPAPREAAPSAQANATAKSAASAEDAIAQMVPQMDIKLGDGKDGGLRLSGTVGIVVMMGLLTLLPTLLLMMTGFTRILIVLHFLKQAMGTQGAPPAHLLAGLALLLTGFVMAPTLSQVNRDAITPWLDGQMTQVEMMKTGVKPMREFMLKQTRPSDLKTFIDMSRMQQPNTPDDVPLHVLMSAFVASELRTAFQIGFAIYLPFIVIDAVVASVLMSMGMFMLPPAMISLPFKLLLFVLVDGWSLTITSLVQSFR